MTRLRWQPLTVLFVFILIRASVTRADPSHYFKIRVVDSRTGRGVPLVELRTTNEARWFTDSNGLAAIDDAGLMGRQVFFTLTSHGYRYPKDGFGYTGVALYVKLGGSATIKVERENIAERLYRITGEGIYQDSVLLGLKPPTNNPVINGLVMGQDTVEVTRYQNRLFWFWGDTSRPAYPLGNFRTSGATSLLPDSGGLDPEKGVDLSYFTDAAGFCRAMLPSTKPGPIWIGGLCTVKDADGRERLLCNYARMKSLGEVLERGLAVFNDQKGEFDVLAPLDTKDPQCPLGHPFHATTGGTDMIYSALPDGEPAPCIRVQSDLKHITDPLAYESYTCLEPGAKYEGAATKLERGPRGEILYGWKHATDAIGWKRQQELVKAGKLKTEEGLLQLRDVLTGKSVTPASGSVYWNAYRHRWVMIVQELGGTSLLGEVWYAEADTPVGPWVYARKIISHNNYSFYNPTQDPFLDQDGGRRIHLEGTYTKTFTNNQDPTPRYDYNQIMYGLSLDDPLLALPGPIYMLRGARGKAGGTYVYTNRDRIEKDADAPRVAEIPFFAPTSPGVCAGMIPVYGNVQNRLMTRDLTSRLPPKPLFYALPAAAKDPEAQVTPLYEYHSPTEGWYYSTDVAIKRAGLTRSPEPICRVWQNPMNFLPLDWQTQAIKP